MESERKKTRARGGECYRIIFTYFCTHRPIAGYINFCSGGITSGSSDLFIFSVAKHEVLHALVSCPLFLFTLKQYYILWHCL